MTTKLTISNSFMNNQELKDLRDKTIENTTDETTWGGTVKLEEIEEAMKEVKAWVLTAYRSIMIKDDPRYNP